MEHINYNDLVHSDNRNEAREAVRRLVEIVGGGAKELPSCQQVLFITLWPYNITPFLGLQNEKKGRI